MCCVVTVVEDACESVNEHRNNIVSCSLYLQYDAGQVQNRLNTMSMTYPFAANVTVVGTIGLAGSDRLVMGPAKQIVVGVDLLSDVSNFQLWYDINGDQLKHRVVTKLGVQVAYPEFWVSNNRA